MSQWTGILKRCGVLPIFGAALAVVVGVAAFGQASRVAQNAARDPDYPPPYDNSKADRALRAFDEGHPKCALWSDWHKLCARTGPNGSTYCKTDIEHSVLASEPFCAATNDGQVIRGEYRRDTKAERLSRLRFSVIKTDPYFEGKSGKVPRKSRMFRSWLSSRPFSGEKFYQIKDPGCEIWWYPEPVNGSAECSEVTGSGIEECAKSQIYKLSYRHELPTCIKWKINSWCHISYTKIESYELSRQDALPGRIANSTQITQGGRSIDSSPVHSEFCNGDIP